MDKDNRGQLGDPGLDPKVVDPAQDEKPEAEQSYIPVNPDGDGYTIQRDCAS